MTLRTWFPADAALSARDIRIAFASARGPARTVLDGVDVSVAPGQTIGIVGRSGSGKTTLLRVLLGLQRPASGTVSVGDWRLRERSTRALRPFRRHVQYVPQDPAASLDPRMTVAQLVLDPLRRLGIDGDHDARLRSAIDAVRLPGSLLSRRPGQISGGQAQRVALARALATGARILLADEPISGLDLPLRGDVLEMLRTVSSEQGVGVAFVSHDLDAVDALCERTVVLADGRIVEEGPTAHLLSAPKHPATCEFVAARPTRALAAAMGVEV